MSETPAEPILGLRVGPRQTILASSEGGDYQSLSTDDRLLAQTSSDRQDDENKDSDTAHEEPHTHKAPFEAVLGDEDADGSLWIETFLTAARQQWQFDESLPVVVSVPGAYDASDAEQLCGSVTAAGFETLGVVREPLSAVYAAGFENTTGTVVVGRLGHYWLDAAVVQVTDGESRPLARRSLPESGLRTVQRTRANAASAEKSAYEALEGLQREIVEHLRSLTEMADVDTDEVGRVMLAGPGAGEQPLQTPFEGVYGVSPETRNEEPLDVPFARGAAIAGSQFGSDVAVADPTLRRSLAVSVLGTDGVEHTSVAARKNVTDTVTLRTTEDNQTWGLLPVVTRHRAGRDTTPLGTYAFRGIPPAPAGEVAVTVDVTPTDHTPTAVACTAAYDFADGGELTVERVDSPDGTDPWFGVADPEALPVPDREPSQPVRTENPTALTELSPEQAVERLLAVRNELATAVADGQTLSPAELEVRVRKVDVALRRAGVEVIDPDPGTPVDDHAHRVERLRPAQQEADTVAETIAAGYRIDDTVEQPARVVISEGPPETETNEE